MRVHMAMMGDDDDQVFCWQQSLLEFMPLDTSSSFSINASCLECVNWQRIEVTMCTRLACPHYAVRPYQKSNKGDSDKLDLDNNNTNVEDE